MFRQLARVLTITVGLLLLWQIIVMVGHFPSYILPTPVAVFQIFKTNWSLIAVQAQPTIAETLIGLLVGTLIGSSSALVLALFKPARLWVMPILVLSQAIPTFAIAPLLIVWLGYGEASKIATAAIMIFFPITSNFYDGLQQTPTIWLDLAKTMGASRWQRLWRIQVPAALPQFASGLRVATAIAPIGAIMGEWIGSSRGLGYLMLNANARMQIDMMFAALLTITVLALALYFSVDKLLKKLIWW